MKSLVFPVFDASRVSEVRGAALHIAQEEGLSESLAGAAGLVATECATNVLKHAKGGEIHVSPLSYRGSPGVEILAIDSGPGMADTERCLTDGFSSTGTHGSGLGAIRRSSQFFDLYSVPGKGTVVVAQVTTARTGAVFEGDLRIGVLKRPLAGEVYCGDDWAVHNGGPSVLMMLVDGLGHGMDASQAAAAAVDVFGRAQSREPRDVVLQIHNGLKSTRGAAVSVALADFQKGDVVYAGLGNIVGTIANAAKATSMVSLYGTCGHNARKIQEFTYPLPANGIVVLHSDGLSGQWNLQNDPGLVRCHPALIAAVLYQRAARARDDASILVLKKDGV